jgi:hypothetical protein
MGEGLLNHSPELLHRIAQVVEHLMRGETMLPEWIV